MHFKCNFSFCKLVIIDTGNGNCAGVCFLMKFQVCSLSKIMSIETSSVLFGVIVVLIFFLFLKMIVAVKNCFSTDEDLIFYKKILS